MHFETAPANAIATFVANMSFKEQPLMHFLETMPVGETIKGILIMSYTDSDNVDQYPGALLMQPDGIMFIGD